MNDIATEYVKLVLAIGVHDPDYVDAYYGPAEWRETVEAERTPLDAILRRAQGLAAALEGAAPPAGAQTIDRLRHHALSAQVRALIARVEQLQGRRFSFDEESRLLYEAVAHSHTEEELAARVAQLEADVPGDGPLHERLPAYRMRFAIPRERLPDVFQVAVDACRARTQGHIFLPEGERFTVEYVTDKPWSGYNWYRGGLESLIQVNTDLPIFINRAVDLAGHEGYPGHHVYNTLLEQHLVRARGWTEFTVYALHSPQSLIAEGTANFGVDVVFPGEERLQFERDVLFPLAGLDPAEAERFYRIDALAEGLTYAGNEAARRYLDGRITADDAVDWLVRYTLTEPERARQRLRFTERYRSYVINYNLGKDLVRQHVEARGGSADHPDRRWAEFTALLTTPRVASALELPGA